MNELIIATPYGEEVKLNVGDHVKSDLSHHSGTVVGYGRPQDEETDPDEYVEVKTIKIKLDDPYTVRRDGGGVTTVTEIEQTATDLLEWYAL